MSEAIWIELIKVLPAFLWVGFGFIALAIAKRLFTAQAPRMTKVETPWVTVELAQQAIEQAALRDPVQLQPPGGYDPAETDWTALYPLPTQQVRPGNGAVYRTRTDPQSPPAKGGTDDEPADADETVRTEPPAEAEPDLLATPPVDAPADTAQPEPDPHATVTAPNQQIPNIPPTFPVIVPPGNAYYTQAPPGRQAPYWSRPGDQYQIQAAYGPSSSGSSRSLRAATKLALSARDLQGGAIMWVDDHPESNETLIRLFRSAGITVDPVSSTDEAMRAFEQRSYDLVITDMRREHEPEGDTAGLQLLDRMVAAGIPTPAAIYASSRRAYGNVHPRAVISTSAPERLVEIVVEFVGDRRERQSPGWLERLTGN
jgi:CheY-like chemotaxis protein